MASRIHGGRSDRPSWDERLSNSRRQPTTAILCALVVLVAIVDLATGDGSQTIQVSGLAALIAAMLCTTGQVVLVGMFYTAAVVVVYTDELGPSGAPTMIASIGGSVVAGIACVLLCQSRWEREDLLARVRFTAEAAQRTLLRELPLHTDDAVVDGLYVSSARDALIGGDIYEVLPTPYGTRVLIGDVRGKGLPAIHAGAAVLTSFREGAYHQPSVLGVCTQMEEALLRHNHYARDTGDGERFVTALVLQLEPDGRAEIVGCGHTTPFRLSGGRAAEIWLDDPGLPLGLGDLAGQARTAQHCPFAAGDRMVLCTDGVTEARDAEGVFYPLVDRLSTWAELPSPELVEQLGLDLVRHTGDRQSDDAAILVVRRNGSFEAEQPGRAPGPTGRPPTGVPS
ncbi:MULTISPECIES: PP2C family protein-serine/threonine phosphatase [unclassified Streptomyces]|uniref:PP2C family protein-serine/threonine phosphatase n=1 Tax=unclassified Streptomyces TaxID=2593676 RepID=UPI003823D60A